METVDRRLLAVVALSAAVIASSIATANVVGEVSSSWLWVLLVPVGLLGAGLACLFALGAFVVRRLRA